MQSVHTKYHLFTFQVVKVKHRVWSLSKKKSIGFDHEELEKTNINSKIITNLFVKYKFMTIYIVKSLNQT